MSSAQSQRRPMAARSGGSGRGSAPFIRSSAARRAPRHDSSGFVVTGWRTAVSIGRGPKQLWPYLLPWLVVLATIGLAYLIVRDVQTRQLLVPPVETPQSLSERGYTSSFVAERIMAAMREIGQDAESIPHDTMADSDARPDIQIPGQDISYGSTVRFIKGVIGRDDVAVRVGITRSDDGANAYVAHLQIEHGPFSGQHGTVTFEGRDLDTFVRKIAVEAMRLAEPNILASHLFTQVQKSRCSYAQCDYREIFSIYDDVLKLPASEQGEWATAGKAWLLTSQRLSEQAERETREALNTYADSAVLRASLGVALEQQQRIDDAIDALRAGAQAKKHSAENLRLLGDVLLHAHRYPEALDAFQQAYDLKPDSVETLHDWGEALIAVGRYNQAIEKLKLAVNRRPDLAPSYAEWGRALDRQGDLRGAAHKYAMALHLDPHTLSARETELARFAATVQEPDDTPTKEPGARVRPVSNPPAAYPLRASLDAIRETGGSAMHPA
ncbi:tetratricopeptide repeat protein [Paraburkholderia sp. MMS20-SJTR3]|uniref:Tetratricopeptide repeat protein n=1 Tax=Paraburkholderia sejongensis TaxID=2886946 RepID=A0ABS8JSN0_9BURK|nr:tetratricopeptide repeat protein [Paraburkholderia sp. MMS20-SJTR3]MCC8392760.1 tetratricopeptide repeat protein [Paraburkholderia sp. MMS20-SJTR3]